MSKPKYFWEMGAETQRTGERWWWYLKSGPLTDWLGMAVHRVRDTGRSTQSPNGHCTGTLGATECI